MIIDAHQHFWQLERGDYGWLTPELSVLYRDFMPNDLTPILRAQGIDGTILVQAAPTVEESEFLLSLAATNPFILGVVGWVDFTSPAAAGEIARCAAHPKLVGLRPMIQDINDDDWMLRKDLAPAFNAMLAHDLAFDALVLPRHLSRLHELRARYPRLRIVIDHGAKPMIAAGHFDSWARDMASIAQGGDTYCKLSGLLTEAGPDWSITQVTPYIDHLLKIFGRERLIWGSDWPVLTLAASYERWLSLCKQIMGEGAALEGIWGKNAVELYKLRLSENVS